MNETKPSAELIALDETKELKELSKNLDDGSKFVRSLHSKNDKKLYKATIERLRNETNNALTNTEYLSLARMAYWCDKFEEMFSNMNAQDIDPELYNLYRLTLNKLTDHLKEYRMKSIEPPSTVKEIRNYIINVQEKRVKDKFEPEIIDVTGELK